MPVPARLPISQVEDVSPGGAHVLDTDNGSRLHRFEACFEKQLLHEGIADLHIRPFLLGLFGKLGGRHRRAMNAVPPRLRAYIDHRVSNAGGFTVEDFVVPEHAKSEYVDQWIAVVTLVEDALPANGRNAEAVAVMSDARNDTLENAMVASARLRIVQPSEADGIHHSNGPRSHGENVAQDAADPRRCALKGLDKARVVVRFDLEGDCHAVADVDDSGILARPLQHVRDFPSEASSDERGCFYTSSARSTLR